MTPPVAYVMDTSVTLSWLFDDEVTPSTRLLFRQLPTSRTLVPELWLFELSNAILNARRRNRVSEPEVTQFLDRLLRQPLTIDRTASDRALSAIRSLADRHNLTAYDATYLDLAIRAALPLATLDDHLARAAREAGVPLVETT
jgi:predicted nucleic acid-binding protein